MSWEAISYGTDRCGQVGYVVEWQSGSERNYRFLLNILPQDKRPEHPAGYFEALNGELEALTELTDDIRREVALHIHKRRYK